MLSLIPDYCGIEKEKEEEEGQMHRDVETQSQSRKKKRITSLLETRPIWPARASSSDSE